MSKDAAICAGLGFVRCSAEVVGVGPVAIHVWLLKGIEMNVTKKLSVAAMAALALAISGCGDSADSVAQDTLAEIKSFTATLKNVKDAASAKANESAIKAHGEKLKSLMERGEKFTKDDPATQKKLEEKYGKEMETAMGEFIGEMSRVGMLGPDVHNALKGVEDAMK